MSESEGEGQQHAAYTRDGSTTSDVSGCGGIDHGDGAEKKRKKKARKRFLYGTVGAGLTAASGVLIARSDDVGEWLQSVAPNVLPHAEAGADIVLRAIAEAKSCIEEGVNVCLDAEGRVTALCENKQRSLVSWSCSVSC